MVQAADKAGLSTKDYCAVELQLASFQSVKDFAEDLKKTCAAGSLDRRVCPMLIRFVL